MSKELLGGSEDFDETLSHNYQRASNLHWIFVLIYGSALFSWIIGSIGLSFAWIVILVSTALAIFSSSVSRIIQDARNEEIVKIRRRKALSQDETAEWLNFLFNRWWACSSTSTFQLLRDQFEPLLNEVKPSFVESVEFRQFTFGDQTPCIKSIKAFDILDGKRMPLTTLTMHNSSNLIKTAQHKIAMVVDLYLNSEEFRLLLKTRLFGKGVGMDLDIALEKLNICGKLDIVLSVDMDSPFPHVTDVSVMFLEKPEIWFSLRMLKTVQMMEVPILKTWIHSVFMDALETSLVDPGKLEFKLSGGKDTYQESHKGVSSAQGVLTITLTASQPGYSAGDLKWVVLRLGDQYCKTSPVTQNWSEAPSFLVESLQTDKLIIKLKNKRLVSTITVAQYEMNLIDYNLDYSRTVETLLQKKSKTSSIPNISVRLEYTPLVFDMIDQPLSRSMNCFVVSGVLTVLIHGAQGLTFGDSGPSNSYCVIYVDRKKVKTTHCIPDSTEPQWESRCQFLVNDYTKTSLSFVVCSSWNQKRINNDEMLGLAVLNLTEGETCITNKVLALNGSANSASITVSVTFQPISEMSNKAVNDPAPQFNDSDKGVKSKTNSQSWMSQAKNIIVRNDQEFHSGENIGNILTSGQGLLEFNLLRARDLLSMDKNGFSDPYYELQINGECKYKSSVKKKTLNPTWDENGIVPLPRPGSTLDLILWDHDTFGKNDFLGRISFTPEEIRDMSCANYASWYTLQGVRSGQVEIKIRIISDALPSSRNCAEPTSLARRVSMERSKIKLGINVPPPAPPRNFSLPPHKNATETLVQQIHRNFMNDMTAPDNSCDNTDAEKKNQIILNDGSSVTRTSSRASSCRTSDFSINEYSPVSGEVNSFKKHTENDLPPFKSMKQKVTRSLRLRKFRSESNVRMQNGNTSEVKEVRDFCQSQTSLSQPTSQVNKGKSTPVRPTELNVCPTARPDRYSGIEGKVLQAQGLHVAHVAQLYCRIKLIGANTGEKGFRGQSNGGRTLAKSDLHPAVPNPQFNLPFQIVSPESVARQAVLQFEIRSSGKENVALRRVTLQDILSADGQETHTWLALNNGASLEVIIAHGRELKKSSRKLFRSWSVHRIGII
ncbi:UNVERIFIED_CONTAM: hypothetical protein PYX00_007297 [Menopon gallinae]